MSDLISFVVDVPGQGPRIESRQWVIEHISGGDQGYEIELSSKTAAELAVLLQDEFDADPDYWEGRTVTVSDTGA